MQHPETAESLSEIVDKINDSYGAFIRDGFSPGAGRRVVPAMRNGTVAGWRMQALEDGTWLDLDETPFDTVTALIAHYREAAQR